jgi:quercetin dioxygenase-like cupin family protein
VYIHALTDGDETADLEILAVYFDAGSRTKPHTHSTEQPLYFLEGEGVVADRADWLRYLPGGMAVIPAGEWHWHGATLDRATCHLSIRPGGPSAWPPEVAMEDGRPTWRACTTPDANPGTGGRHVTEVAFSAIRWTRSLHRSRSIGPSTGCA